MMREMCELIDRGFIIRLSRNDAVHSCLYEVMVIKGNEVVFCSEIPGNNVKLLIKRAHRFLL